MLTVKTKIKNRKSKILSPCMRSSALQKMCCGTSINNMNI